MVQVAPMFGWDIKELHGSARDPGFTAIVVETKTSYASFRENQMPDLIQLVCIEDWVTKAMVPTAATRHEHAQTRFELSKTSSKHLNHEQLFVPRLPDGNTYYYTY